MKRLILLLVVTTYGCAEAASRQIVPPHASTAIVAPSKASPEPEHAPPPPPLMSVVAQQYQQTAQKEARAVTAANVTPDYIRAVHAADLSARAALGALEAQGQQATQADFIRARIAVRKLGEVLDDAP